MPESPNRRQVIQAGLAMGTGIILLGCQRKASGWKPLSPEELEGPPHRTLAEAHPRPPQPEVSPISGIVSRREWTNSQPNMSLINPMNGINRVTVHHDGMPPVNLKAKSEVAQRLEQIRRAHVGNHDDGGRNWADIGYHYIIDPQGRVWEGRPVRFQGAHVKNNNEHNLGIMCLGNFDEQKPTPECLATLDAFLADRMRACRISLDRIMTHQEINPTACPGKSLQAYMRTTRSGSGRLARA